MGTADWKPPPGDCRAHNLNNVKSLNRLEKKQTKQNKKENQKERKKNDKILPWTKRAWCVFPLPLTEYPISWVWQTVTIEIVTKINNYLSGY